MASAFFVCKRREKIYRAGKIRQAKQVENQPGAGERAEFPQRKIRPKWRLLGKKIFWKEECFFNFIVWQYQSGRIQKYWVAPEERTVI